MRTSKQNHPVVDGCHRRRCNEHEQDIDFGSRVQRMMVYSL